MTLEEQIAAEEKNISDLTDQLGYFHSEGPISDWFYTNVGPWLETVEKSIDKTWETGSDFAPDGSPIKVGKTIYDSLKGVISTLQTPAGDNQQTAKNVIEQLKNLSSAAELSGVMSKQDANEIKALISALKSGKALQDGDYKEYASNLINAMGKLSFLQKHADKFKAAKAGKGLHDITQSFKKGKQDFNELKSIQAQKNEIELKLQEAKKKLENLKQLKNQNTIGNGLANANVFTRINELLAQINTSIQQLNTNLPV